MNVMSDAPKRLVRLPEALKITAVSRTSFYEGIKTGLYPRPVKTGPGDKISAWPENELQAVVDGAVKARDHASVA
jgi:prophage regulatory protein